MGKTDIQRKVIRLREYVIDRLPEGTMAVLIAVPPSDAHGAYFSTNCKDGKAVAALLREMADAIEPPPPDAGGLN